MQTASLLAKQLRIDHAEAAVNGAKKNLSAYTAIVIGSTGAVGSNLVANLLKNPKCSSVIALTRRELSEDAMRDRFLLGLSVDSRLCEKLKVRVVDFDNLRKDDMVSVNGQSVDAVFCCLGTTRGDAGSAEAFRKVDFDYVHHAAKLVKQTATNYFGLVTTVGANKFSWFLYLKTKGEIEEAVKSLEFPRFSIFRPGLMDRGRDARLWESIALKIGFSVGGYFKFGSCVILNATYLFMYPNFFGTRIPVETVAQAMIRDFESATDKFSEFSDSQIRKIGSNQ